MTVEPENDVENEEVYPVSDDFDVWTEEQEGKLKVSLFFGDADAYVQFWLSPEDAEKLAHDLICVAQDCRVSEAVKFHQPTTF
jgi:hypothetical protein